jgi:2-oxoacid dehydrogenases acyltransferase (catalytic domain)
MTALREVTSHRVTGWRKLAPSTWGPPNDPQFYGDLDIDAGTMLEYVHQLRTGTGVHVTVTHLVGRAVAHGLTAMPELSVRLARGRQYPRESTDVFFIVEAAPGELTGRKVENADRKSVVEVATEPHDATTRISHGTDASFGGTKRMLARVPRRLLRPVIRASAWLTSDRNNLDLAAAGLPRQAFGGAMITSVGRWGISHAYSPLAAYYRVPVLVLVVAVTQRPVARAGQVVIRPMLTLTATFNHRYVDGGHAARFAQAVLEYCSDPSQFEPHTARPEETLAATMLEPEPRT